MGWIISKLVLNRYLYFGRFRKTKTLGWSLTWEGLRVNGTSFGDKSLAEDHLDMALSEMKQNDNSKLEIIKV